MSSSSPKVPIPLPVGGVMKNQNPRTIGPNALVDAKNWVFRDGSFRVRDGVVPMNWIVADPAAYSNMMYNDDASKLDVDVVCDIRSIALGPPLELRGTMIDMLGRGILISDPSSYLATAGGPFDVRETWLWYQAYGLPAYMMTDSLETWMVGDPAFLNVDHSSNKYIKFTMNDYTATGEYLPDAIWTPPVAASQRAYGAQFKYACSNVAATLSARLVGISYTEAQSGGSASYTFVNEDGDDILLELNDGPDENWVEVRNSWADPSEPTYLTFDNSERVADYVAILFYWEALDTDYMAISDVMINEGEAEVTYSLPSTSVGSPGTVIGQRPMGMAEFEQSVENIITVAATDHALFALQNDFTWDKVPNSDFTVNGTVTAVSAKDSLPVMRVFDGTPYTTGTAKKYLIMVNNESDAIYWDGDGVTNAQAIDIDNSGTGAEMVAKCLAICFNRVLYCGISDLPDAVSYSEELQFGMIGDTVRLADTPGHVVGAMEMGNLQAAIYKSDAIYMAIGQGGSVPFRFELRTAHIAGPASPLAIVALSDGIHCYLADNGDVIMFDGVRPRSMGQHVQAYIQATIDYNRIGQSFGFYDRERKELYFMYPPYGGTEAFHCVMINLDGEQQSLWPLRWKDAITTAGHTVINLSKTIGELEGNVGDLPGLIGDYTSLLPRLLLLSSDGGGNIFAGNSDWQGEIEHYLQTGMFDLGQQTLYKTVKEIDHLFHAEDNQTITVEILISNFGKEQKSDGERTIDLDTARPRVTRHRATGRMFSLKLSGEASGLVEWLGSEASYEPRGGR